MNDLMNFEYKGAKVRTVMLDGEPWFVLTDVCRVLDLSNPTVVAGRLKCDDIRYVRMRTEKGVQSITTVSEPGFYRLLMHGNKEKTRKCSDVLIDAVLKSFRQVEKSEGLESGFFTTQALECLANEADVTEYPNFPKQPVLHAVPDASTKSTENWYDETLLIKRLNELGMDATLEKVRNSKYMHWAADIIEALESGLDVTPNSLLGRIGNVLRCQFAIVKCDASDSTNKRGHELAERIRYKHKERFGVLDDAPNGGKYARVKHPETGEWMPRSHFVAGQSRGKDIQAGEMVHHVNGDKADDREENLICMTRPEHSRLHSILNLAAADRGTKWWHIDAEEQRHLLESIRNPK